jgi:hypothetical protein
LFLPAAAAAQSAQKSSQTIENVVVTGVYTAPSSDLAKLPEPLLDTEDCR